MAKQKKKSSRMICTRKGGRRSRQVPGMVLHKGSNKTEPNRTKTRQDAAWRRGENGRSIRAQAKKSRKIHQERLKKKAKKEAKKLHKETVIEKAKRKEAKHGTKK